MTESSAPGALAGRFASSSCRIARIPFSSAARESTHIVGWWSIRTEALHIVTWYGHRESWPSRTAESCVPIGPRRMGPVRVLVRGDCRVTGEHWRVHPSAWFRWQSRHRSTENRIALQHVIARQLRLAARLREQSVHRGVCHAQILLRRRRQVHHQIDQATRLLAEHPDDLRWPSGERSHMERRVAGAANGIGNRRPAARSEILVEATAIRAHCDAEYRLRRQGPGSGGGDGWRLSHRALSA